MGVDSGQRGACDRCRGQKLRCIGLSGLMPAFESEGRIQRNEKPCDRCRKAQVECFSVRPASRKKTGDTPDDKEKVGYGTQRQQRRSATKLQRHTSHNSFSQSPLRAANESDHDGKVRHEKLDFSLHPIHDWQDPNPTEIDWDNFDHWNSVLTGRQERTFSSQEPSTTTSTPYKSRNIQEPSDYFSIPIEHDLDMSSLGTLGLLNTPNENHQSSAGLLNSEHVTDVHLSSAQARQACIRDLTELNEILLRDKKTAGGRKHVARQSLSPLHHPITSESNRIGRTLQHSHTFIHILQRLRPAKTTSEDARCSHFLTSYDDSNSFTKLLKEHENIEAAKGSGHSSHSAASLLPTAPLSLNSRTSTIVSPVLSPLDMPTILSLICCYAYIVEAYSSILSEILDCMLHSPQNLQTLWSGLTLDGFNLDGHLNIQLECLLHITGRMLDKMEKILLGSSSSNSQDQNKGILDSKLSAGLLDALYCRRDSDSSSADPHKELRVKRDMRSIQSALKCLD
ncbi:C6 finger domain-containing protein [Phlyctema vagabunda]|uniref:C6 finger domain-containing protein n=1 Tax=Phlyctema vagabunda TaxID=108571 RepID=A0ABR4PCY1_9HELO